MNAKRLIIAAAALITVAGLIIGWKDARAARATESAVAATTQHRARVETDLRQAAERIAAADKDRSALQSQLDGLQKPKRSVTVAPEPPAGAPDASERLVRAMEERMAKDREDPKRQNLWLAARRVTLAADYALLFRTLGLSPAQAEKFLDIECKRDEQSGDIIPAARSLGLSMNDPAVNKLVAQTFQEYAAAQKELLGEEGFRQRKDYERTTFARSYVSSMAGAATVAGVPFTTEQAGQLVQVLANADSNYLRGRSASLRNIDWDAVEASARAILSEPQYAYFQQSSPRFSRQYVDVLDRARKADAARAAAPAAPAPGG